MFQLRRWMATALACVAALFGGAGVAAQEKTAPVKGVHVLGLENVSRNLKGTLSVEPAALRFDTGAPGGPGRATADVSIGSIEDVWTGDDSKRLIGGPVGTLTMFAPYGSGRFLSLFRLKIDVLTVEYRDAQGALHGVVFTLPVGQAAALKKQLVARGARASVPVEEETKKPKEEEKKQ